MVLSSKKSELVYKIIINTFINYFILRILIIDIEVEHNFINFLTIILISAISVIIMRSIFRRPLIFLAIIIAGILGTIYIKLYHYEIYYIGTYKLNDFIDWSIRFTNGFTSINPIYSNIFLLVLLLTISIFTSFLIFSINRTWPLIIIGTVLFLYKWFNFIDSAIIYYGLYITFVLMLYTLRKYKSFENKWKSQDKLIGNNIYRNWVIYSIIICSIIILIPTVLPINIDPIKWKWLDKNAQEYFPQLTTWRNTKKTSVGYGRQIRFDLSLTEYQDGFKKLGGPIEENSNILVMKVESDKPGYLKGRVKDFYTGSYWKSTDNYPIPQVANSNNTLLSDKKINGEINKQTIEHVDLLTSTIFNSNIPESVSIDNKTYYSTKEFELFIDKLILKGEKYRVTSIKPYIDWEKVKKSNYKYKEEHEMYLQLPKDISNRIKKLAKDITKDYEGDYEKVKAIESYLKNNFKYTLKPEKTPYNREFVDYFLFDLKKGYCSYFATSMGIMTRSIGIPSRYIEGFKMPEEKEDDKYYVYSDNAHAWVEVYIEGYGWMVFEPTPGFSDTVYNEKEIDEKSYIERPEDEDITDMIDRDKMREQQLLELKNNRMGNNEVSNQINSKSNRKIFIYFFVGVLILICIILIKIIYSIRCMKIRNRSISRKDNREKVLYYYGMISILMSKIGREKLKGETAYEHFRRLKSGMYYGIGNLDKVTEVLYKAKYSKIPITNEEVQILKEYFLKCEKTVIDRAGRFRFIIDKYVKGDMYINKND